MSDLIAGLALVFLSSLMMSIIYGFSAAVIRTNIPKLLINAIVFFCYIKVSLYYFLPAIMRLISGFQFEYQDGIDPKEVVFLYLIELISWFVYFAVMILLIIIVYHENKKSEKYEYTNKFSIFFLVFSVAGLIVSSFYAILGIDNDHILQLFSGIFFYCAIVASPILLVIYRQNYNSRFLFYLAIIGVLISSLTISTRGAVVYMLLLFIFLAWNVRVDNKAKKIVIYLFSGIVVGFLISGGTPSIPVKIDDNGQLVIDFTSTSEKKMGRTTLEEIEWRFGASTRMGTKFFVMYDRGDSAGILPIKHSAMGFLPRFINEEKPIPSTVVPDDIYSMGMYLIYRETHGYDTYSMTEFPTGSHFYWEFGIIGVLVLSAVSSLYIFLCVWGYSKMGLAGLAMLIASFKPWGYMDPKIWVSDAIIQIYQIVIPVIFLYVLFCIFEKINVRLK